MGAVVRRGSVPIRPPVPRTERVGPAPRGLLQGSSNWTWEACLADAQDIRFLGRLLARQFDQARINNIDLLIWLRWIDEVMLKLQIFIELKRG